MFTYNFTDGASINRGNISVTIKNDKIRLDYISMFGTRIVSRYKNEVCAAPEANSFKDDHEEYWIWELSLENVQEVGKTVKQKKCYVDVIFVSILFNRIELIIAIKFSFTKNVIQRSF